MKRRQAILAAIGSVSLASCHEGEPDPTDTNAQANQAVCNLTGSSAQAAKIDIASFYQTAAQNQYQNLWCWAACISMIFASKGRPVKQERIVSEAYGRPYNMPAPGAVISSSLNRTWVDDFNRGFTSVLTGVYDAFAGVAAISDETIVNTIANGTPMVIGTGQHAMVLIEIDYIATSFGPQIAGGQVFDPWTGRPRCLSASELTLASRGGSLMFLAAVQISTR